MTASTTYQAVLNEGRQAGILEGLEKGREQGREEGRIREALRILLNLGTKKHGDPPERLHQLLNSIDSIELLEQFIEDDFGNRFLGETDFSTQLVLFLDSAIQT